MNQNQINKEDGLFYLEMINSNYSPTYTPKIGERKKYLRFINNYDSDEYQRFICVYQFFREKLEDRDKEVLDLYYRINGKTFTIVQIGKILGVSGSRVQQLKVHAEYKLAKEIWFFINGWKKSNKRSFYTIIVEQSDEVLVEIGKATRPWEPLIINYFNKDQSSYFAMTKRKILVSLIYRIWYLDMLNHREQALKILNLDESEVYLD